MRHSVLETGKAVRPAAPKNSISRTSGMVLFKAIGTIGEGWFLQALAVG